MYLGDLLPCSFIKFYILLYCNTSFVLRYIEFRLTFVSPVLYGLWCAGVTLAKDTVLSAYHLKAIQTLKILDSGRYIRLPKGCSLHLAKKLSNTRQLLVHRFPGNIQVFWWNNNPGGSRTLRVVSLITEAGKADVEALSFKTAVG